MSDYYPNGVNHCLDHCPNIRGPLVSNSNLSPPNPSMLQKVGQGTYVWTWHFETLLCLLSGLQYWWEVRYISIMINFHHCLLLKYANFCFRNLPLSSMFIKSPVGYVTDRLYPSFSVIWKQTVLVWIICRIYRLHNVLSAGWMGQRLYGLPTAWSASHIYCYMD